MNGFPLVVYGVSDLIGQFHPISFMITSHETEEHFNFFFKGLIMQCDQMNIEFHPAYIMQDAYRASYNSIKKYFPDCKVLMRLSVVTDKQTKINIDGKDFEFMDDN